MRNIPRLLRIWFTEPLLSTILTICMVTGIAIFILLTIHISYQLSWDEHIHDYKNIWRIEMTQYGEIEYSSPGMSVEVFKVLRNRVPQIKDWFIVNPIDFKLLFTHNDESVPLNDIIFCSKNVPEKLNLKMVYGTWDDCLEDSKALLISRSRALQIFGDTDPRGEQLMLNVKGNKIHRYTISGVFEDVPHNQHIQGDYFTYDYNHEVGDSTTVIESPDDFFYTEQTYVVLQEGTDPQILADEASKIVEENRALIADMIDDLEFSFRVVRMDETHYDKTFVTQFETFDKGELIKYAIVAFAILMVLVTNSMILLTVRTMSRKKEIDVRRNVGAGAGDIFRQFIGEHLILYLGMVGLAAFVIYLLLPYLNVVIPGYTIENINWAKTISWIAVGLAAAGIVIVIYPSFIARMIMYRKRSASHWKLAMLAQITVSLVLIISAMLLIRQIHLLDHKYPGYDPKGVTSFYLMLNADRFHDEVMERAKVIPGVEKVSHSNFMPSRKLERTKLTIHSAKSRIQYSQCRLGLLGGDFFDMYRIPVVQGRVWDFHDTTGVVVNEAFMKLYGHHGIELGTEIEMGEDREGMLYYHGPIIGVVEDSYWEGLRKNVEPIVYGKQNFYESFFNFRIAPGMETAARQQLWEIFKDKARENFFYATMYDTNWEVTHQCDPERNFMKLMVFVAIVGMFFTFVGIFGLTAYTLRHQMKNLAIRQVLGATPWDTLKYMLRNYMILLGVSLGITIPVTHYLLNRWLEGFASRVSLTVLDYFMGLFIVVVLILSAVVIHWLRLHRTKLIDFLRSE